MSDSKLTTDDVGRLITEHSPEARAETAAKIASHFDQGSLSPAERQLAEDIFRLLVKDAEVRVRQALSTHLKESALLPHDVAVALARDVDDVSLPILQFSKVLTDQDLIAIVRSDSLPKQMAITRRPEISSAVSEVLVDTGKTAVVASLVANEGADISAKTLDKVEREFRHDPAVTGPLLQRSRLPGEVTSGIMGLDSAWLVGRANVPMSLTESLVNQVSEQFEKALAGSSRLADGQAADLMAHSRERATIELSAGADREDVEGLVRHLNVNGRLTPSIVLRAVCVGDTAFFEAALSELAKIPSANAVALIHDPGKLGFKALYDKAGLPAALFAAFRCALDVARENQFDGGDLDRERYCRRMVERILTQYETMGVSFDASDLDYLLARIRKLPDPTSTVGASPK
ncbi:MAG TPA: DUF2336 domain-containing protein [Rhodospirillaceae bacterium]|nr:DUF2336 domain-containing protein [Rhodospirillaceae bacterium]